MGKAAGWRAGTTFVVDVRGLRALEVRWDRMGCGWVVGGGTEMEMETKTKGVRVLGP